MKSVTNMQEILEMPLKENNILIDNEIFEFYSRRQIKDFWGENIKILGKFENFDSLLAHEFAMKNILTVKNRICHTIPKLDKNEKVFEWIIGGLEATNKYSSLVKKTSATQGELIKYKKNCTDILNILRKSIEVYYGKPHSDPHNLKIKEQLTNNLKLVEGSLNNEIQLPANFWNDRDFWEEETTILLEGVEFRIPPVVYK